MSPGPVGGAARHVLGERAVDAQAHRQAEVGHGAGHAEHGAGAALVVLHLVHVRGRLDRDAAGVEGDPLAHQGDAGPVRRPSAGAPGAAAWAEPAPTARMPPMPRRRSSSASRTVTSMPRLRASSRARSSIQAGVASLGGVLARSRAKATASATGRREASGGAVGVLLARPAATTASPPRRPASPSRSGSGRSGSRTAPARAARARPRPRRRSRHGGGRTTVRRRAPPTRASSAARPIQWASLLEREVLALAEAVQGDDEAAGPPSVWRRLLVLPLPAGAARPGAPPPRGPLRQAVDVGRLPFEAADSQVRSASGVTLRGDDVAIDATCRS